MNCRTTMTLLVLIAAVAAGSARAAIFEVDSTADAVDLDPGDGLCLSAAGECTLRAAVMQANASPGTDTIDLTGINDPLQPITLTLAGVDETFTETPQGDAACAAVLEADAAIGDLDITEDVTIEGAGPNLTVVRWATQSLTLPAAGDRVFHVQSNPGETVDHVRIADLMIANGGVGVPADLDANNPYNCEVSGATGSRQAWQFRRYGGGIAIGAGAGVVLFDEALHGDGNSEPDRSAEGGAAAAARSSVGLVELERVAVIGNRSGADGGGLDVSAPVRIADSVFSANQAAINGGALYLEARASVSGTLIGSASSPVEFTSGAVPVDVLAPNEAMNGGGIFATGAHTSFVARSAINLNEADAGGAIAGRTLVRLNVSDTTISGNTGSARGGGITTSGVVALRHVTLANNRSTSGATRVGGGLDAFGRGTFLFANSLFSNNVVEGASGTSPRDANCGCSDTVTFCQHGPMVTLGFNLGDEATDTCLMSVTVGDQLAQDPLLDALAANGGRTETHRLPSQQAGDAATSPAVDAAGSGACTNADQRGSIRPDDGDGDADFDCDVGAFELFVPRDDLNIGSVTVPDRARVGEPVTLTVVIRNDNAATDVPAVTYAATVAPTTGLEVLAAVPSAGTCAVATASSVDCAIGMLAAGEVATVQLTLSADAQGTYTVESEIDNDPSVADPVPGNNKVVSRIAFSGSSDVALSVTADAATIRVEDDLTFDYVVSNAGEDDAENLRFQVDVPLSVAFFSASYSPQYSCFWSVGTFQCLLNELAAGDSAAFRLIVTGVATGDYTFESRLAADQDDPDPGNNTDVKAVTIRAKQSSGGGGGCAYNPAGPADVTLPVFLLALLGVLAWRHRSRA